MEAECYPFPHQAVLPWGQRIPQPSMVLGTCRGQCLPTLCLEEPRQEQRPTPLTVPPSPATPYDAPEGAPASPAPGPCLLGGGGVLKPEDLTASVSLPAVPGFQMVREGERGRKVGEMDHEEKQ